MKDEAQSNAEQEAAGHQAAADLQKRLQSIDSQSEADAVVDEIVRESSHETVDEAIRHRAEGTKSETTLPQDRTPTQAQEVEEAADAIEDTAAKAAALEEDEKAAEAVIEEAMQESFWRQDKDYERPRRLLLDAFLRHRSISYLERLDAELFLLINARFPHPPFLNRFFRFIALIFRNGWAWQIGMLLALPFRPRRTWTIMKWAVPSIYFAAFMVEQPIKRYFQRRRPFLRVVRSVIIGAKPSSWSFPSGHSAAAFAGAHALAKLVPGWSLLWYAIAFVVGFCRTYLGAHYPTDVAVGSGLGILHTEIAFWLLRRLGLKQK